MASIITPCTFFKQLLMTHLHTPKRVLQNCLCARRTVRLFSSNNVLSDTSIMIQSGSDIQELPLVVKKLSSVDAGHILFCKDVSSTEIPAPPDKFENLGHISREEEIEDIISGFDKCNTLPEVFRLLEMVPSTYVEPPVAFSILKKISELDDNQSLLNEIIGQEVTQNFTKTAVFNQLIDTILSDNSGATLVNCLKLCNQHSVFRKYFRPYRAKLIEKIMINVTKNGFSVAEICDIVEAFHIAGNAKEVDKLWIGITENAKSIDFDDIVNVFQVLPYFNFSRKVVLKVMLERLAEVWWYVEGNAIVELLHAVKEGEIHSPQLMQIIGRWLNTKIHAVTEDELLSVLKGLTAVDFVNMQVISAVERYVKMRADLITNPALWAAIMDYCEKFKICSPTIMEKACNYFISKGESLSPAVVTSLFVPFGTLHFTPTRSYEFWKVFELVVENKFTYFKPENIIDMMLACIYLEKYPINFVNHIFNPYFLTRLQCSSENWSAAKNNLALFDHFMSVNYPSYRGPLLPKEIPPVTLSVDKQLKSVLNKVKMTLVDVYGRAYNIKDMNSLPGCPSHFCCTIDVHMKPRGSVVGGTELPSLAVLVHTPEDFTYDGTQLLGLQQFRIRHFTKMGMKVISLNYLQVVLRYLKPADLTKYLAESIDDALKTESY